MKSASILPEQRVVLEPVSWSTFLALLADVDHRHGRMAYDQGVLEIMSPSLRHQAAKSLLRRLLEAATEVLGIDIAGAGSVTMKREDLQRAIEPDECYFIGRNASAVRGKEDLDLRVDPPPDLAIEVDISRSSMNKLGIYGALGVREVWRYDGDTLTIRVREPNADYSVASRSLVLPTLPLEGLARFLARRDEASESHIVREFRAWLTAELGRHE